MSTTQMAFDDSRARKELGYAPRPAEQAVEDSARWFVDNGYVKAARRARITWRSRVACSERPPPCRYDGRSERVDVAESPAGR